MQYKTRFLFPVRWSCFRNFDENGFCWTFNTTSRSLFNSIFHWQNSCLLHVSNLDLVKFCGRVENHQIIKLLRIQLGWINAKWFQGSNRILFAQLIVWLMFQNSIQNHHNQSYLSFLLDIYTPSLPRSDLIILSHPLMRIERAKWQNIGALNVFHSMNVFCFNQFISI